VIHGGLKPSEATLVAADMRAINDSSSATSLVVGMCGFRRASDATLFFNFIKLFSLAFSS
jgi:hypothetical protein